MRRVKIDETDVSVKVVAYSWQRDSLIILQLINILIPYGSLLFFSLNGQMWLMVKFSAELDITSTDRDFDTTITFNASTGK